MAQLIIEIPNEHLQRVIEAYKSKLEGEEAVDLNNPTGLEISAKLEVLILDKIKSDVKAFERQKSIDGIITEDF